MTAERRIREMPATGSVTVTGPEEQVALMLVSLKRVADRIRKSNPETPIVVVVTKSWS